VLKTSKQPKVIMYFVGLVSIFADLKKGGFDNLRIFEIMNSKELPQKIKNEYKELKNLDKILKDVFKLEDRHRRKTYEVYIEEYYDEHEKSFRCRLTQSGLKYLSQCAEILYNISSAD